MAMEYFGKMIEVFAEDLFRYLLPRRMNIIDCSIPGDRPTDIPIVFHPHIGMSVLCESQRRQKDFFAYFASQYPAFIKDNRSFMTFCAHYARDLCYKNKDDTFKTVKAVSSMILELGVFCHMRGYKHFKYYAAICCAEMLKYFLDEELLPNYDWNLMKELASDDADTYIEAKYEIVREGTCVEYRTDWLRSYDLWAATYHIFETEGPSCDTEETSGSESKSVIPENREETGFDVNEEIGSTSRNQETVGDRHSSSIDNTSSQTPKKRRDPLKLKFEPGSIPVIQKTDDDELLGIFKLLANSDSASGHICRLLRSEKEKETLMNNDSFLQAITQAVMNSKGKLKFEHILELAKLVLLGNDSLEKIFIQAAQYVEVTEKLADFFTNEFESSVSEINQPDVSNVSTLLTGKGTENLEASAENFPRELGAIPKRKEEKSVIPSSKTFKKLLKNFKRVVSAGCDVAGFEICEILENPDNVNFLLNDNVFKTVMQLTVEHPLKRWGNEWILSFAKTIIRSSKQTSGRAPVIDATNAAGIAELSGNRENIASGDVTESTMNIDRQNETSDKSPPSVPVSNFKVLDPDNDAGESEDMQTVFVDIVNLGSTFQQLIKDVLHGEDESPSCLSSLIFNTPSDEESIDQSKTKKRSGRKNRRRNRSRRSRSLSSISSVSPMPGIVENPVQSIEINPEEIQKTFVDCIDEEGKSASGGTENDLGDIIQQIAELQTDNAQEFEKLEDLNTKLNLLLKFGSSLVQVYKLKEPRLETQANFISEEIDSFLHQSNSAIQSLKSSLEAAKIETTNEPNYPTITENVTSNLEMSDSIDAKEKSIAETHKLAGGELLAAYGRIMSAKKYIEGAFESTAITHSIKIEETSSLEEETSGSSTDSKETVSDKEISEYNKEQMQYSSFKLKDELSSLQSKNTSCETVEAFIRVLDLMPISFPAEVSYWIYRQLMENEPGCLEALKDKDIDENIMKVVLKYRVQLHEMNKAQSSLDLPENKDHQLEEVSNDPPAQN